MIMKSISFIYYKVGGDFWVDFRGEFVILHRCRGGNSAGLAKVMGVLLAMMEVPVGGMSVTWSI